MRRKVLIGFIGIVGWLVSSFAGEYVQGPGAGTPPLALASGGIVGTDASWLDQLRTGLRSQNERDVANIVFGTARSALPSDGDTLSVSLLATDDAYVRIGPLYYTENFGSRDYVLVQNRTGPHMREAYFAWDISDVPGQVVDARIRLTAVAVGPIAQEHHAWLVPSSDWNEAQLTWSERPEHGEELAAWTVDAPGTVDFDVDTAVLSGADRLSVRITSEILGNHRHWLRYATREADDPAVRPVLMLKIISDSLSGAPPVLSLVDVHPGPLQAVVSWESDRPATSSVLVRRIAESDSIFVHDPVLKKRHRMVVAPLDPSSAYAVQISSSDGLRNRSEISEHPFASEDENAVIHFWTGDSLKFGHLGTPTRYVNVLGQVAPGIVSIRYQVNDGPLLPASLGPDGYRLQNRNDFNIEVHRDVLPEGENAIRVVATDGRGNEYEGVCTVMLVDGNTWALPYQAIWSNSSRIEDAAEIVDGRWQRTADGIRTNGIGYDRLVTIGDTTWSSYEITVPVTIHGRDLEADPAVGIVLRWHGHQPDGRQPSVDWEGYLGTIMLLRWKNGNERFLAYKTPRLSLAKDLNPNFEIGQTYIWKTQVRSLLDGMAAYRAKYWLEGEPEPTEWPIDAVDEDVQMQTGSLLLVAHHTDVTFGNVTLRALEDEPSVTLAAKVFLEGAYSGPEMHTILADVAQLPLAQPYSADILVGTKLHYSGTEAFDGLVPADMVDWVLVALSPEGSPSEWSGVRAGVLLRGGEIVDVEGDAGLKFPGIERGRYFVTVRHRNHLGIISEVPVEFEDGTGVYDFTSADFGDGFGGIKSLGDGSYGMIAGDADASGQVQNDDRTVWRQEAGRSGYLRADFNMDGQVQLTDDRSFWRPNVGRGSYLP